MGLVGLILLVAVPLLSGCTSGSETAALQAQADQVTSNKEVMHKFVELFESGNWDDLDQVIASDCVLHYPGGVDVNGLEAMKAGWGVFFGAMRDMHATPVAEISEGDLLVDFLTFEATYEGDLYAAADFRRADQVQPGGDDAHCGRQDRGMVG